MSSEDGDLEGLDEAELEILREASIITGPSTSDRRRRKSTSRLPAKHVIFADSEEQGMYSEGSFVSQLLTYIPDQRKNLRHLPNGPNRTFS